MKKEKKSKLSQFFQKLLSMKELLLVAVVLVAVVVYVIITSFDEKGVFVTTGHAVSGDAVITNLTSGRQEPVEMVSVDGSDTIYERSGKIYWGDEKKTRINTEFPMYVSGGSGLRFLDDSAILIDSDFQPQKTYDGLILNGGTAFNLDGSTADFYQYLFVKLSNGLIMNALPMEIETELNLYYIPSNSILLMRENSLQAYSYQDGVLVSFGDLPDLSLVSTVRIGGQELSWKETLTRLGLYKEPAEPGEVETGTETETENSEEVTVGGELSGQDWSGDAVEDSGDGTDDRDDGPEELSSSDLSSAAQGDAEEGEAEGAAGASGKSKGKKKSGKGGSSGSGGEPATAEKPQDVPMPPTAETEPETSSTPVPETLAPTKGGKKPAAPSSVPAGAKENPDWKDPSVIAGTTFIPGIYTLKTSVTINDPAGAIVSGITYEVVIMDEYGKMTLYKRVSVKQQEAGKEMTVLISGLKPESQYSVTGTYRYRDKYGIVVKESRTFLETKAFETRSVAELGPIKLEDLQLELALPHSNFITIPHLRCTEESDQDAIGSLAKATVRFNEGKPNARGVNLTNTQLSKLKSYQPISFSSTKDLDSSTRYSIDIVCYDQFYNQLRVEDPEGKSQWFANTCYALPAARIKVTLNANGTVSLKADVTDPDKIGYTDLKLAINNNALGELVRLNYDYPAEDIRSKYLALENGKTVVLPSMGNEKSFTAQVWCVCDPKDGYGNINRQIGTERFTTTRLDELGALYVETKNITYKTVEDEAAACATEKERTAKLKEKSTRIVLTLQLNKEETNPSLYDPSLNMVNDFTVKLASGEESHQISLTEEERKAFLNGDVITIDTNDKVRYPYLTGLTSNTTYSVVLGATHWYDREGKETAKIVVITSLGKVKTDIRNVEIVLDDQSVAFFEGFISMNIKIVDLDGVIDGNYAVLRIREKDTGANVGAWKIEKNKDEWYELRLKGTGSESYEIKADTTYTCTFIAEEAHPEGGYQTYYVLRQFDRNTGKSLTGKIYNMGLSENSPVNDSYRARLAYELNVPEGEDAPEAFRKGVIYVDEFRNSKDASGTKVKEKVDTVEIPFDEKGLHPTTAYVSVENGSDYRFTGQELEEGLKAGTIKSYDIPSRYLLCEYIENYGKSYINTGYNPGGSTGLEADVFIKSYLDSWGTVYGANGGGWSSKSYAASLNTTYVKSDYQNEANVNIGNNFTKRLLIERYLNGKFSQLYINGSKKREDNKGTFSSPHPLFLCAMNWDGTAKYFIRQKIYSFRIYEDLNGNGNDRGEIVREFLPCYDTVEQKFGLYDTCTGVFVSNADSSGGFTGRMIASRYYYVGADGKQYRLMEEETPRVLERQVKKNNKSADTYSYEMYFIYAKGTTYETKVPLSYISFSTEQEILTIASGEEFVTRGANAKKYVVINDISYDNRDCTFCPLATLKANIDFQGFSFETWSNYYTIVNTSTRTAGISNMVLKSHAALLSVVGANTSSWDSGKNYRGGMLFTTFYGTATNLYIEFSQETPPYVYNTNKAYTYWSTLSPAQMEELPDDDARSKYKYRIQPTVASFVCDNYGIIENFVIDLKSEIIADNWAGGLACANVSGGAIRNGYIFSSVGASLGQYGGKMTLYYGYYAERNKTNEGAVGGIVGYVNTNAVVENCYALLDIESYPNKEISRHTGGIAGMTTGSTAKVQNSYMIGDVYYTYSDDKGVERHQVFLKKDDYDKTGLEDFGPAAGRIYSGGKPQNLYYISGFDYTNTVNTKLSAYALKNKVWQNNVLNAKGGFTVDSLVDVGFYPHVAFTSDVMPVQANIPLPTVSLTQKNTDVAYSYKQDKNARLTPAAKEKLDPVMQGENYGNEAWDAASGSYYASNELVACVLLAESDETRVVYSMEVEHFQLTHEDILYQYKDGTGIIQVYVKLHNPDACLSQYRINKIVYEDDNGAAGDVVVLSGARYINADYFKRIRREKQADGADSWEAMVKKYGSSTFLENLVLKTDLDFADMPLTSVLVRGGMNGKVNGGGFTISNILYDPNLAKTYSVSSADTGMGLFNKLYNDVWDLTLDTVQLEGGGDTGALCAQMFGAGLDHVFVKNSYLSGGRLLGGIAGIIDGGDVVCCGVTDTKLLHNSGAKYSSVGTAGYDYFTGGITGQACGVKMRRSFVQNAYIENMYLDYASATGGLVGYLTDSYSYLDGCYATGVINSNSDFTGGLVGLTRGSLMSLSSCYSDVDLYAWTYRTEQTFGMLSSGEIPASVISFGNTAMAGIYERGSEDERTANMHLKDFESSIQYDSYVKGQVFDYLSNEYFASGTDFASGVLPQIIDETGTVLPNQNPEYVGADFVKVLSGNAGINLDSSSIVVTPQGNDQYKLDVTVHHSPDIRIRDIYFGFNYVDELADMADHISKLPSFTDSAVLKAVSGRSVSEPESTVTEITYHGLAVDAAYDRYFITGIEYEQDGEVRYQRAGYELTAIGQKWKTISSISDWKGKLYGTHCENFRVTGDIDFAGETVLFSDKTANGVVNRLVGDLGSAADYLSYKGGVNQYRTIRNLTLDDSGYSLTVQGFWQNRYCRGLIGVVNSEMGCLTFEDINVTGKYNTFGVIGGLTGHAHHMNLSRVHLKGTASGANHMGFIAYLKDGVSQVYMNDCTLNAKGSVTGILVGNLFNYTHNNTLKDIYAENCTAATTYGNNTSLVATGIVLGLSWRDFQIKCNYSTEYTAAPHMENITVSHCNVTSDGYSVGAMAGYATGILTNCTVKDCEVTGTGYIVGGLAGTGGYFHATGINVERVKVRGSGQVGAITGRTLYYDGYYYSYNCYINNSVVKDCEILGEGSLASESYLWYVGGMTGYMQTSSHSNGFTGNLVENCTVTGRSGMVGGLVGSHYYSSLFSKNTVRNCVITGKAEVGGMQGGSNDGYTSRLEENVVEDCSIVGTTHVGGLVGYGGQPLIKNRVENCTIVGTEYNVGGAVGYLCHSNYTSQSKMYDRQNDGNYAVLVKNSYIYGRSYVGGAAGTISRVGMPTSIVQDCEVRGYSHVGGQVGRVYYYGSAGASNQLYRYAYDGTVQNTLITEMDKEANSNLMTKFGVHIDETATRAYFGGGMGYAGSMQYCLVDNCMIAAPNSDFVGALQGYYYLNFYPDYADSKFNVSRDCVVIGRNYVGGLYGAVKSAYNKYYVAESRRVTASCSYSNAAVTGENYVAGIAGLYAGAGGQGEADGTYNPKLTNLYFTGTLEATGTSEGSGIVSAVLADQAVNYVPKGVQDPFQLDGIVSMPTSIRGQTVYPVLRDDAGSGWEFLKSDSRQAFVTLWKGTSITQGTSGISMADILDGSDYKDSVFSPSEYSTYIDSSGKRIDGTDRFIMALEDSYAVDDVVKKALRNSGYFSYGKAFGNITEAEAAEMMPLVLNGSVRHFGKYSLTVNSKAFILRQGVYLPGSSKDLTVKAEKETEKEQFITSGTWTGGTTDIEKYLAGCVRAYAGSTTGSSLTVEFKKELYDTIPGTEVSVAYDSEKGTGASFTTTKGDEGYYSALVTEEQTVPELIPDDGQNHSYQFTYNFMDTLTVNLSYQLTDGREGILGIHITPDTAEIRSTMADSYRIIDGSILSNDVVILNKADLNDYQLPDGYSSAEYVTLDGNQYVDTGVRCRESEVFLDFSITSTNGKMFIMGRALADHHFLLAFDASGNGFGYFGSAISNNFTYQTKLKTGTRYMLHTVGLTGNLMIQTKNLTSGGSYTTHYSATGYNHYIGFNASGKNESILLGGGYSGYNKMKGRIYGMKIYSNGRMAADLVPVIASGGRKGLYDLVNKKLLTSLGSKQFDTGGVQGGSIERGEKKYIRLYTSGSDVYALDSYGRSVKVN